MKSNKGFSLVELIVVIAIMAIIAGVAIPVYTNYIDKANGAVVDNLFAEAEYAAELAEIEYEVDLTVAKTTTGCTIKVTTPSDFDTAAEQAIALKALQQVAGIVEATTEDATPTFESTYTAVVD